MNTDEYEISITREIKICKYHITRIKNELDSLENTPNKKDEQKIKILKEELNRWEERLKSYEEYYKTFRKKS